jgi:sarcosine oxidase subunit gamma
MTRLSALSTLLGRPGEALRLAERHDLAQINLRGDGSSDAFQRAVASALGAAPPRAPNATAQGAECTLIWLGPDEWLVQLPYGRREQALQRLRAALQDRHAAVTDVSDGDTVLVLDHPRACELLSRGCPLDFDESVFPVGACAQSVFSKTNLLLVREAPQRFAVTVRRSFARYLYEALQDAAELDRS